MCAEIVVRLGLGVIPVMVTATGVWGAREERVSSPGQVLAVKGPLGSVAPSIKAVSAVNAAPIESTIGYR